MNLIVKIPDDVAQRLEAAGGDLSRRALEALAIEEYKRGRLTKPELRRLLGFETSAELDAFFKAHEVFGHRLWLSRPGILIEQTEHNILVVDNGTNAVLIQALL